MTKVKMPAIEIEIPRMGQVVYVSPLIGAQDGKPTAMFTAEIAVNGKLELQSFHLKCRDEKEAKRVGHDMKRRLDMNGPYPFLQTGIGE